MAMLCNTGQHCLGDPALDEAALDTSTLDASVLDASTNVQSLPSYKCMYMAGFSTLAMLGNIGQHWLEDPSLHYGASPKENGN